MFDPEHIEARLPPQPNALVKRLKLWAGLAVVVCVVLVFAFKSYENWQHNQALAADNVIKFSGLAFSVHNIEVRPINAIFAVRAELRLVDLSSNRSVSATALMNGACSALLASDLVGVDPSVVFRVTIDFQDPEERVRGQGPIDVSDAQCRVHMLNGEMLYTMPEPLNGWVLRSWTANQIFTAADSDVTLNISFTPRVDADPDLAVFDHLFACKVVMADWPDTLPKDVAGRDVTQIRIEPRLGLAGTLISFGRYTSETFDLTDDDCVGEAV